MHWGEADPHSSSSSSSCVNEAAAGQQGPAGPRGRPGEQIGGGRKSTYTILNPLPVKHLHNVDTDV